MVGEGRRGGGSVWRVLKVGNWEEETKASDEGQKKKWDYAVF